MEILHFKDLGDIDIAFQRFEGYRNCRHECSLDVNLVTDKFSYIASANSPLCQIV